MKAQIIIKIVQQAAAWSRGADYQTEMRMRSRIYQIYGSLD